MTETLYTYSDGGARGNPGPAACAAVLANPDGKVIFEIAKCLGEATNNVAEYNGMIMALEQAKAQGAGKLVCHADSELIVFQLQGVYKIKDARMLELSKKVKSLAAQFDAVVFRQIPREHAMIRRADKLLNKALNKAAGEASPPAPLPPGEGGRRPGEAEQGELF